MLIFLGLAPAAEEKRLAVYTPQTSFILAVTDHNGSEYISITDLLDPFGRATLTRDGKRWRLRLEAANKRMEGEFNENSTEAKVRGKKFTLARPFFVDNQRGYVPVGSATTLLTQFAGGSANLRENSRRLFVGDVSTTYSAELQKGTPTRLLLRFSAPVNPTVATETGRIRLTFSREPLQLSGANTQPYDDSVIRSLNYAETNGAAELTIATAASALVTFSDGGKTISVAAMPPPTKAAQAPATPAPATPTPSAPPTDRSAAQPQTPPASHFIAIIDPAHGGEDTGAALGGGLFEKDITLAIARRLRSNLDQRGIWAVMARDGDATLSLDQRATAANVSRASVYISIHAATLGSGVRLYTARFNSPLKIPDHGFLPWDIAQAKYLDQSHNLAANLIREFEARQVPVVPFEAGLRPLRNIAKPAIAIEVAPLNGGLEKLATAAYQQSVADAIGAALANMRSSMEVGR